MAHPVRRVASQLIEPLVDLGVRLAEERHRPIPNQHSDVNEIPTAVVKDLIALGSLDDSPSVKRDQLLARLKPFDRVNRLGWARWYELADTLSEIELRNLVRGLTTVELELDWCGGSVAGVIWVYRRFESRFPDKAIDAFSQRIQRESFIGTRHISGPSNQPLYRFTLFSRHPLAEKFWNEILKIDETGQRELHF